MLLKHKRRIFEHDKLIYPILAWRMLIEFAKQNGAYFRILRSEMPDDHSQQKKLSTKQEIMKKA